MITSKIKALFYSRKEKRHALVGPAKLWKMKQQFQIDFLKNQGLKSDNKLLDIGCGTLRGGIPIIKYLNEGNYHGIDVRKEAVEEGLKELEEENLSEKRPTVLHFEDFSTLQIGEEFDVIFAFSVLIHLSDEILGNCLKFAASHLKNDGAFYANINIGNRKTGDWQGFPVVFRSIDFYKEQAGKCGLTVDIIGDLKTLGHNSGTLADEQIMLKLHK